MAPGPIDRFLRDGWAALGLGALYAGAASHASLPRRLSFAPLAAAMNLLSLASALPLATSAEALGLPLVVTLTCTSAVWAAGFAWIACRWLRWSAPSAGVLTGGLLAGTLAFMCFAALREVSASFVPLTALLAAYWSLWMTSTTLVITRVAGRRASERSAR